MGDLKGNNGRYNAYMIVIRPVFAVVIFAGQRVSCFSRGPPFENKLPQPEVGNSGNLPEVSHPVSCRVIAAVGPWPFFSAKPHSANDLPDAVAGASAAVVTKLISPYPVHISRNTVQKLASVHPFSSFSIKRKGGHFGRPCFVYANLLYENLISLSFRHTYFIVVSSFSCPRILATSWIGIPRWIRLVASVLRKRCGWTVVLICASS